MQAIPVPEIVVVLVVVAILAVAQQLWGIRPFPFLPRPGDLRPRQPPLTSEQLRARLVASDVIFAIISLPLILRLVPPNGIYGFRTGRTQSSHAVWYAANAFHGWALLGAAVLGAALLFVLPDTSKRWQLWAAFVIPVSSAIAVSLAYLSVLS
jgi:SdpI/YhfL family protein